MNFSPADGAPISADESPAFAELYELVEKQMPETPQGVRGLVFCMAYTLYKKRKKVVGSRLRADGKSGKEIASTLNLVLANQETYLELVDEAKSRLTALTDATSNQVLSGIAAEIIEGVDKRLSHEGSNGFINRVTDSLDARLNHTKASNLMRFVLFLKHSAIHGLHIVVAALMIYFLAKIILFVGPVAGSFLDSLGFKYLGEILKSLEP